MPPTIRDAVPADVPELVEIIRTAFRDVALRFDLTPENCPRHPSNCRESWIEGALGKGVHYFILDAEGGSCGCVALEQASSETCYLERLAVLPAHQRRGYGRALVVHALAEARALGVKGVEIGLIAAQTELWNWYRKLGFVDQKAASFPHLPFQVLFSRKSL